MHRKRLEYIDLLKAFAILAIISLHVFQVWTNGQQILGMDIYAFSEITRFGVPTFIMVSGALLLNRDIEIKSFLKRRVTRIIYPFLFFYILTFLFTNITQMGVSQTANIFAFKWYFWMILGVYLSIPIINKFIQNASMDEIEYFILIFIFASIFYQLTHYFKLEQYFYLNLFLSPLGYLVLGYYLSKKEFHISANKLITISIFLFVLTTFLKTCGRLDIIPLTQNFAASTSPMLSSWLDVGFLEIIQTSSFFLICKYVYETSSIIYKPIRLILNNGTVKKFILSVSRASYGMYLINTIPTIFFHNTIGLMSLTGSEICESIILLIIAVFIFSWIFIVILGKIPYIKQVSGYY